MANASPPALLLIRPANRLAQDQATCLAAGWQAVPFCPIQLNPNETTLATLANAYQAAQAVFWVSPSAVEIAQTVLSWQHDDTTPNIAVGAATAAALQQAGCPNVIYPTHGNDSEAVAQLAIWQTLPRHANILIVRGQGGREWLAHDLRQRGFVVSYAEIYQRTQQALDWRIWHTHPPQAAWITSSELVNALFQQAPPEMVQNLQSLLYLTHHTRIAHALHQQGAQYVQLISALTTHTLLSLREKAQ